MVKYCCSHCVSNWQQMSSKRTLKEGWFSNVSLWKRCIMSWNVSKRQQGRRGCFSWRGRILLKGPVTIWNLTLCSSLLSRNRQPKRCFRVSYSTQQWLQHFPVLVLESWYRNYVTAAATGKVVMVTALGKHCLPKLLILHTHLADLRCIIWVHVSSGAVTPRSLDKR